MIDQLLGHRGLKISLAGSLLLLFVVLMGQAITDYQRPAPEPSPITASYDLPRGEPGADGLPGPGDRLQRPDRCGDCPYVRPRLGRS